MFSKNKFSSMKRPLFLIIPILVLNSCASYKLKIDKDKKDWEKYAPADEIKLDHTIYLIGDAGYSDLGEKSSALQLLEKKLKKAPKSSHVIFLGDNIYPGGLPPDPVFNDYELANHRLNAQIDILKEYKGHPLFIPGNHDWYNYGLSGLITQEDTIEKRINVMRGIAADDDDDWENYFLPDDGCSGPEVIEVNKRLVIIVIDSQWWLTDWDKEPRINDGCEAKSRKAFTFLFGEVLKKHKNKNVVIALHHPPYTYGPHGGYYSAKQHLFPLTQLSKNLYIPLPGLGSFFALLRGSLGSTQDTPHQDYKDLKRTLLNPAKINGSFIFVSGHDHNMQYIEEDRQQFIISGAGSKNSPVALGKGSEFAFGDKKEQGFAQLDFYKDGSAWVQYWVTDPGNPDGKVVYRKKIKDKLPIADKKIEFDFSEFEEKKDSVTTTILNKKIENKGWFHNMMLGKHYRTLYTYDYDIPVLDLSTFKGGMTPIKRGGGNQTNSLRLKDSEGNQWVMRAMQKDASRLIPYPFNKITASQFLVEDNFLSTHPYAAFVVPDLAKAAGIYHTNPKMYYIPKQPSLGQANDDYGGEVYLVEERPAKDWRDLESFGNSKKIISTTDMVDKLLKSHKYKVDQSFASRSRLFDLVIGDWDRHGDQWRWASFKKNGHTVYRPIPRDRDQPFGKYDGLLTGIISLTSPAMKQLKVYKPEVKNIKWETYSARSFDRTFLNELSWEEWQTEVKYIQENLTDEAIDAAFKTWPKQVYEETGKKLAGYTKIRRDKLMDTARKHYEFVSKKVDVIGTNKREKFKVERLNDNETLVTVYNNKKGKDNDTIVYQRLFYTKETKEIRLFGLNGDDKFEITGKVKKGPLIRIIGGLDEDEFSDESKVSGLKKKTIIYDTKSGNELKKKSGETKNLMSNVRENNIYNRKDYHYEFDFLIPLPIIAYNPDDGLALGANLLFTHYGFKKDPYASTHLIHAKFAIATQSLNIKYVGNFIHVFGKTDFLLKANYQGEQYVINFFGLGNDTKNPNPDFDYNRVRERLAGLKPLIKKRFAGGNGNFTIGPLGAIVEIEKTPDRFITSDGNGLTDDIYDPKYYTGGEIGLNYVNTNGLFIPTRGVKFHTSVAVITNVREDNKTYYPIKAELTFYQNIDPKNNLVFATRIGTQHNIGEFEFFQAAVLGGKSNMRGYRSERFSGRTSFYHNLDLRWRLFNSENRVIPFSFGISGGFDYGRVWADEDEGKSSTWHKGYGGGIWMAPVDFFVLYFELFQSVEGNRFVFKAGYAF
jgi:hypothetical protein